VTSAAAGEARKTTAWATSSTVPRRPIGMRSSHHFLNAGSSKNGSVSGAMMKVGAIDTTRTPFGSKGTILAILRATLLGCLCPRPWKNVSYGVGARRVSPPIGSRRPPAD